MKSEAFHLQAAFTTISNILPYAHVGKMVEALGLKKGKGGTYTLPDGSKIAVTPDGFLVEVD